MIYEIQNTSLIALKTFESIPEETVHTNFWGSHWRIVGRIINLSLLKNMLCRIWKRFKKMFLGKNLVSLSLYSQLISTEDDSRFLMIPQTSSLGSLVQAFSQDSFKQLIIKRLCFPECITECSNCSWFNLSCIILIWY